MNRADSRNHEVIVLMFDPLTPNTTFAYSTENSHSFLLERFEESFFTDWKASIASNVLSNGLTIRDLVWAKAVRPPPFLSGHAVTFLERNYQTNSYDITIRDNNRNTTLGLSEPRSDNLAQVCEIKLCLSNAEGYQ